jgi:hypothetical protein
VSGQAPTAAELAASRNAFGVLLARYARDALAFVREVFGAEPDEWQCQALDALSHGQTRISIRSGHGVGKGCAHDTIVPTPKGFRRWGDLKVGDELFGRDGRPTRIRARYERGILPVYRVTLDDGTSCVVDGDHLWSLRGRSQRAVGEGGERCGDFVTISTAALMTREIKRSNGKALVRQWELPRIQPVEYPPCNLAFDPFWLGKWLGNGDLEAIKPGLTNLAWLGLSPDGRYVPDAYRTAPVEARYRLLLGLLDTGGFAARGAAQFMSSSQPLTECVAELVRSLGGKAVVFNSGVEPPADGPGRPRRPKPYYSAELWLPPPFAPFINPEKAAKLSGGERHLARWIESIEPAGEARVSCVTVAAADGLFLANDHIPTHNSTMLSWVMAWFLLTRFPCKIIVTAPSAPQLFDALWAELRGWMKKLPAAWQVLLDIQSDHISLKARPDEAFISARTSRAESPDSLQGVHSRHVLLVVDEAAGVPEQVFEAAGGSMSTPGAITILAGNPTRTTGFFWRTHNLEAARWFTLRVSCLTSPRVDPAYSKEVAERYGIESNQYRVRVLGEFPLAEGDTLIPAVLVEDAMRRMPEIDDAAPEIWGVDVARFGSDSSCLVKRKGFVMLEPTRRWQQLDTMQLTGAIVSEFNYASKSTPPAAVVVDAIGIGAGVADRLRELGLPAIDVNVAESPSSDRFVRLRDELWHGIRDWLDSRKASMPWDDQLRAELCAPRYGFASDGKLKVESKDQLRSRGVPSPDSADGLALTLSPAAYLAAAYGAARMGKPLRRNIQGIV